MAEYNIDQSDAFKLSDDFHFNDANYSNTTKPVDSLIDAEDKVADDYPVNDDDYLAYDIYEDTEQVETEPERRIKYVQAPHNITDQSEVPHNTIDQPEVPHSTIDKSEVPQNTIDQSEVPHNTLDQSKVPHNTLDQPEVPHNTLDQPEVPHNTLDQPE